MSSDSRTTTSDAIAAEITATRMHRVDGCSWASPAVREILAEYAADLRDSIPFSVGLDRIRRAIEAERAEHQAEQAEEPAVRLVS